VGERRPRRGIRAHAPNKRFNQARAQAQNRKRVNSPTGRLARWGSPPLNYSPRGCGSAGRRRFSRGSLCLAGPTKSGRNRNWNFLASPSPQSPSFLAKKKFLAGKATKPIWARRKHRSNLPPAGFFSARNFAGAPKLLWGPRPPPAPEMSPRPSPAQSALAPPRPSPPTPVPSLPPDETVPCGSAPRFSGPAAHRKRSRRALFVVFFPRIRGLLQALASPPVPWSQNRPGAPNTSGWAVRRPSPGPTHDDHKAARSP